MTKGWAAVLVLLAAVSVSGAARADIAPPSPSADIPPQGRCRCASVRGLSDLGGADAVGVGLGAAALLVGFALWMRR